MYKAKSLVNLDYMPERIWLLPEAQSYQMVYTEDEPFKNEMPFATEYIRFDCLVFTHRNGESDPPEEPGFYFFKWNHTIDTGLEMIKVRSVFFDDDDSSYLIAVFVGSDREWVMEELDGFFYGPIPQPKEKK